MIYLCGEKLKIKRGVATNLYVRYEIGCNSVQRCSDMYLTKTGVYKYLNMCNTTDTKEVNNFIKKIGLDSYIVDYIDMFKYNECTKELYKLHDVLSLINVM